jgi:two-component sensor histidine kinase
MLSHVLMNAASRSMLISRMHRSFASSRENKIDFKAFAERLAQAVLDASDRPPILIVVEGKLDLPHEQATSVGLVLLEALNARAVSKTRGTIHVTLSEDGRDGVLRVVEEGPGAAASRGDLSVLGALAEQMKGSVVVAADAERAMLHLVFPTEPPPLASFNPLRPFH